MAGAARWSFMAVERALRSGSTPEDDGARDGDSSAQDESDDGTGTRAVAPAARRTGRAERREPATRPIRPPDPARARRAPAGRRRGARRRSRGATPVPARPRSALGSAARPRRPRACSRRSRPRPSASSRPTLRSPNDTGTPCSTASLPPRWLAASRASTSTMASSGRLRRAATTRGGRPAGGSARGTSTLSPAAQPVVTASTGRAATGRPLRSHHRRTQAGTVGRVDDEPTGPRGRAGPGVQQGRSSRRSPQLGAVVGIACDAGRTALPSAVDSDRGTTVTGTRLCRNTKRLTEPSTARTDGVAAPGTQHDVPDSGGFVQQRDARVALSDPDRDLDVGVRGSPRRQLVAHGRGAVAEVAGGSARARRPPRCRGGRRRRRPR